jgi:hypothetical protein
MYLLVLKIEGGKKGRPIFLREIGGANDATPGILAWRYRKTSDTTSQWFITIKYAMEYPTSKIYRYLINGIFRILSHGGIRKRTIFLATFSADLP